MSIIKTLCILYACVRFSKNRYILKIPSSSWTCQLSFFVYQSATVFYYGSDGHLVDPFSFFNQEDTIVT